MKTLRGVVLVLVLIGLAWLLLLFAMVAFVEAWLWITGATGTQHALGMDTQTTHNYAAVSGNLPMIIATFGFSSVFVLAWQKVNCHTPGCPHIGKHHLAGGKFVICTSCLKKDGGTPEEITVEHIHEEHRKHVAGEL